MKKVFFTLLLAGFAIMGYAQETYNFFDPADCDAEGWLWLDSAEKIAKYVGPDRKIKLIDCPFETESEEFPGEYEFRQTYADPELKGYNTDGVQGGDGSKTGGIAMPGVVEEHWWFDDGQAGGILFQMPDCAQIDVYLSCADPEIYTYLYGAYDHVGTSDCRFIWYDDDPLTSNHVYELNNIEQIWYDLDFEGGAGTLFKIASNPGEKRTAYFANYSYDELYLHGIRVKTYTDVSMETTSVEGVVADVDVKISGKVVYAPSAGEISVYSVNGVKVASAYADSLDCSDLSGLYIVKAGNKAVKAVF